MSQAMKDSNCEWIGDIPQSWNLTNIGNIYDARNVKVSELEYEPLSVTMDGIVPQLASVVRSDDRYNRKLVKKGDFVINSRSDRRGAYGIAPQDGSCSLINIVLQPHMVENIEYYNYMLCSKFFPDEFYRWGNGIVADLWTTRWDSMKRIPLPEPSEREKRRIICFLNEKCKKIDAVISKTIDSIGGYKKLREGIITEVITNGLKKDRVRIQSGIKWYGEIPQDWKVIKLRRVFHIKKVIARRAGLTVLSVTQRGIVPKDISKNEGQMATDYSNYQMLNIGEFVMNHMDLLTGWVDVSKYNGVTSPDYRVFMLNDESISNSRYYLLKLRTCISAYAP